MVGNCAGDFEHCLAGTAHRPEEYYPGRMISEFVWVAKFLVRGTVYRFGVIERIETTDMALRG